MKADVGAVIASVVYDMGSNVVKTKDWINISIMLLSFCANYFLGLNVVLITIIIAIFGLLRTVIEEKRGIQK